MTKQLALALAVAVSLCLGTGRLAATDEATQKPVPEDTRSITHHSLTLGGERIAYTATAGTLVLGNEEGKAQASVFYVAYTRDGIGDPAERPVTFSFNGGPGSAAVWVQMGAFGPKKVLADDEGMPLPPPGKLVENPYSIPTSPIWCSSTRSAPAAAAPPRGRIRTRSSTSPIWCSSTRSAPA